MGMRRFFFVVGDPQHLSRHAQVDQEVPSAVQRQNKILPVTRDSREDGPAQPVTKPPRRYPLQDSVITDNNPRYRQSGYTGFQITTDRLDFRQFRHD